MTRDPHRPCVSDADQEGKGEVMTDKSGASFLTLQEAGRIWGERVRALEKGNAALKAEVADLRKHAVCSADPAGITTNSWWDDVARDAMAEVERLNSHRKAAFEAERFDCERSLIALAGAGQSTPEETYGRNTSWAISDLIRGVKALHAEVERLKRFARPPDFPEIVCLCGSTRFMDAFFEEGWRLTLEGKIVLSVGVCKHAEDHGGEALGQEVADALDELHKRKIDLCDRVHVLNVGGYIGKSTRGEIEYATKRGRAITYLEPVEEEKS